MSVAARIKRSSVGVLTAWILAVSAILAACGPGTSGPGSEQGDCVPGRVERCTCADGSPGTSRCTEQGSFTSCRCGDGSPSTDAGLPPDTSRSSDTSDASGDSTSKVRNVVTLPVVVIGPDGTTESIRLHTSDPGPVETLYLEAHSIAYERYRIQENDYDVRKASIRINGGPWVDVSNDHASCPEPEASIGCITSPYHTIRFEIPIAKFGSLEAGENTVDFRFNYADGDPSTGFRILDVELRTASDEDAIDGTRFEFDDPGEWRAPQGLRDSEAYRNGEKLWQKRNMLVDSWNETDKITASCADCHADSGRDLQYFAYSNEAIVERSRFHGLSREQGRKIAAYVRSIDLETSDGTAYDPPGRPWAPPYQPGPTARSTRAPDDPRTAGKGFDEIDQQFWAAGAGLAWALDEDAQTYPYLFPDGISYDDANPHERKLNMRQLPVALQMPDWNEWLPKHHPLDAYGSDFRNPPEPSSGRCQGTRMHAWTYFRDTVRTVDGSTPYNEVDAILGRFAGKLKTLHHCGNYVSPNSGYDSSLANADLKRWGVVKIWETLHTHSLEDVGEKVYPEGERLEWPGRARTVFDIAPHIVWGKKDTYKGTDDTVIDYYYDTAWYQLQLSLNGGHNEHIGIKPVDWNYHPMHILGYDGQSGRSQVMRFVASYLKVIQMGELAHDGSTRGAPEGWNLRMNGPYWFTKGIMNDLDDIVSNGRCHATRVLMRTMIEGMTDNAPDAWRRDANTNRRGQAKIGIEAASYQPQRRNNLNRRHPFADQFYTMIPRFSRLGVPARVLDPLAKWADRAWPKASPSYTSLVDASAGCGSLGDF